MRVTLAAAQLVIARELGFSSWPQLKAAVDAHATAPDRPAELRGRIGRGPAARGRHASSTPIPDVAGHSLVAAAVLGDADAVRASARRRPGGGGRHRRGSGLAAAAVRLLLPLAPDRPWPSGRAGRGGPSPARRRGQPEHQQRRATRATARP